MALGAALSGIATGMGMFQSVMNIFPPTGVGFQRWAFSRDPNLIPAIGDLIEMRFRGLISPTEYETTCKENGYAPHWANTFYEASRTLLNGYEYATLWRRGTLSEDEFKIALDNLRLDSVTQERLKRVTEYFPNPADLVRFAVREVYSPQIAERFGIFEDLPEKFITESWKAGLTEEHARNFWGAHWDLPAARQGFEMLHRRIIDEDDLKLLLRALDVMPYWRDKLIQLSYIPLTRVDVRRMYRLGVLDEEGVNSAYLDRGYSPENAELMTQFTKVYESDETVGLSRANIVTAYKRDLIDLAEVRMFLETFGYAQDVVDFWVDMAEYEKALDEIQDDTTELVGQYMAGQIPLEKVRDELNKKDVPASYITGTVTKAAQQKSEKVKLPTKTDLEDWLEIAVINEDEYNAEMLNLGYRSPDIQRFLTEYAFKRDISKRKYLHIKTYQRWVKGKIMTPEIFTETAKEMRISDEDIATLLLEVQE